VGLLLGGLLTTDVSWRWVLFVYVLIGILAASRVVAESLRRPACAAEAADRRAVLDGLRS
jgi:MFS family permease